MNPIQIAAGDRYHMLTITGEIDRSGTGVRRRRVKCRCDCGRDHEAYLENLRCGYVKSCGCTREANIRLSRTTHGLSNIKEHRIWSNIKSRCYNVNNPTYPKYGGAGIKVCDRWLDFANFFEDMGVRPHGKTSIDRIDNSKGYEPGNCRWADWFEQAENRRSSKYLTHRGKTQTIAQWSRETGLLKALPHRLTLGWSVADAIDTPLIRKHSHLRKLNSNTPTTP